MRFIRVTGAALLLTAALAMPVLAGQPAGSDVLVVKTDSPDPVAPGGQITYTITVQNLGPATADFVGVSDILPAGTTFVSFLVPAGWSGSFNPITGQFFADTPSLTVAAGPQAMTLVVQVNPAATNGTIITNTADVAGEFFDPNEANNSATTSTTVGVPPPTPAPTPMASLADAAMLVPSGGSPVALLGFGVLLAGALSAAAVLAVRRVRT